MTRKIIIVILILLILTVMLQLNDIEYLNQSNPDDIYTSDDFNILTKNNNNNIENIKFLKDTDANNILQEYIRLPYNEMIRKENEYKNKLFNNYLKKEEDRINKILSKSSDSEIKYIYLTKPHPRKTDDHNRAGEIIRKIDGIVYVWQPLSFWMFSTTKNELNNLTKSDSNMPYMECWHREDMRSESSDIPSNIHANYKKTRPSVADILKYENTQYNFTQVSKNEIRIGDEVIKYVGPRKDNPRRIFDNRAPNIYSGNEAYRALISGNDNDKKVKYNNYIRDSINYLNNNVKCFGLQWQTGELFYTENDEICDNIEAQEDHKYGWPNAWALNFYRIEKANDNINDSMYTKKLENSFGVDPVKEARNRRFNIKRSNNTLLILKHDL